MERVASRPSHGVPPPSDFLARFRASLPRGYLEQHSDADVKWHAETSWRRRGEPVQVSTTAVDGKISVYVVAEDQRDVLAQLCAAMMATGLSVATALAFLRSEPPHRELVATFGLVPASSEPTPPPDELESVILEILDELATGRTTVEEILRDYAQTLRPGPAFPTEVELEHDDEGDCLMRVTCLDRPGILAAITRALASVGVVAERSEVATIGGIAVDRFGVVDASGAPLAPSRSEAVRQAVFDAVEAVHRAHC